MIEDDVRKCLETTYASDTFRQVQHRNFGLNYVENYDKKIQNAIYLYNLSLKNWAKNDPPTNTLNDIKYNIKLK